MLLGLLQTPAETPVVDSAAFVRGGLDESLNVKSLEKFNFARCV